MRWRRQYSHNRRRGRRMKIIQKALQEWWSELRQPKTSHRRALKYHATIRNLFESEGDDYWIHTKSILSFQSGICDIDELLSIKTTIDFVEPTLSREEQISDDNNERNDEGKESEAIRFHEECNSLKINFICWYINNAESKFFTWRPKVTNWAIRSWLTVVPKVVSIVLWLAILLFYVGKKASNWIGGM